MPAIRAFSLYAAVAVLINFLLQITVFVAVMALDVRRQMVGYKSFRIFIDLQRSCGKAIWTVPPPGPYPNPGQYPPGQCPPGTVPRDRNSPVGQACGTHSTGMLSCCECDDKNFTN